MAEGCPKLSVAPMMDRTDRHFRYLLRQITRFTLLYTEMVTTQAILRGRDARLLLFHEEEHPLSLQLGGDDPKALAACARIGEDLGYDEINLNCGCPSDRVQSGRFGAVLMGAPEVVAEAVAEMKNAVRIPVTVKHRIGIDERDAYEDMLDFVDVVGRAGPDRFTVHARKAWLSGLSPKENRTIPPLRPEAVYRLKAERPHLCIELNGGVRTLDEVEQHLEAVDAVMIGRAAYEDPMRLAEADARFFGQTRMVGGTREDVVRRMIPYLDEVVRGGARPWSVVRHMLGLFAGTRGGRAYRRVLSTEGPRAGAGAEVLERALAAYAEARLSARRAV